MVRRTPTTPVMDAEAATLLLYEALAKIRSVLYVKLDPGDKQERIEGIASRAQFRTRTLVNSLKGESNG